MAYLFARKRKNNIAKNSDEEDNSSIPGDPCLPDNDVVMHSPLTDDSEVVIVSEPSSPELLSPGNSPGDASTSSTRGTFGLRAYLYDSWFQQKQSKENSEEKYHPLTSNSDENILSSADLMDLCLEPNNSSPEERERWQHREIKLNEKIKELEKGMKSVELENEMLTIMVEDLIKLQETHQQQTEEVKRFYDEKIEKLTQNHEAMVQELIDSNERQITEFMTNHESLIQDLINSHEQQILEWKSAFACEAANVPELTDEKAAAGLPAKILQKFEELSDVQKGLIVIGVGILGTVIGMTSWRFIFWAWPKLVSFAARMELADALNIITWVKVFIDSPGYQKFIQSWNSGEPITKEHIMELGTDSIRFGVTHFGPSLLSLTNRQAKLSIKASKSLGDMDKLQC